MKTFLVILDGDAKRVTGDNLQIKDGIVLLYDNMDDITHAFKGEKFSIELQEEPKTRFQLWEEILHEGIEYQCCGIESKNTAFFAPLKESDSGDVTFRDYTAIIAVSNIPDFDDGFKFERIAELP
jgi:hypothetical protein